MSTTATAPLAQPIRFAAEVLAGAGAGAVFSERVCRTGDGRLSATRASLGLAAAALAYVAFALYATRDVLSREVAVELLGLAFYGGVAFAGAARPYGIPGSGPSYALVAMGWILHVVWDELLQPALTPGDHLAPAWYPGFCVGFDVAVAGRLVLEKPGTPGLRRSARLRREPALRARERRRRHEAVLRFDAGVGVLYATGFLLFPGRTLALFFAYDFDDALRPFLHLAVRMVAINHYGYVAGLLAAPPERAIKVATGFLVLGGAVVVYAGQLWLDTAPAFWSCTALTTALIGAHVIVL